MRFLAIVCFIVLSLSACKDTQETHTIIQDSTQCEGLEECLVYYREKEGDKTHKNEKYIKANTIYMQTCDSDSSASAYGCYVLGLSYYYGLGLEKDYAVAKKLFDKACNGGEREACAALEALYKGGEATGKDCLIERGELYDVGFDINCNTISKKPK